MSEQIGFLDRYDGLRIELQDKWESLQPSISESAGVFTERLQNIELINGNFAEEGGNANPTGFELEIIDGALYYENNSAAMFSGDERTVAYAAQTLGDSIYGNMTNLGIDLSNLVTADAELDSAISEYRKGDYNDALELLNHASRSLNYIR
jgi:hypothetical protein